MSKTNQFENEFLSLLFLNADITGIGDAGGLRGSVAAGNLYKSLHTGDPGETGDQTTNEAAYTGYTRATVPRTGAGFDVTANVASNVATVQWPQSTSGPETETHFGVGTAFSGAGKLLGSGSLTSPIVINSGIQPEAAPGALTWSED